MIIPIVLAIIIAITFLAFAILKGSANEQAHYEKIYSEYIENEKKHGVDL